MVNMLKALGADKKALIVMPGVDEKTHQERQQHPRRQDRSGQHPERLRHPQLHDKFIVVKDAVAKIEEVYA